MTAASKRQSSDAASWTILTGDCRDVLATLDTGSAQTCVTSPPYFGHRDYGHAQQIGLEPTPEEFVSAIVTAFREVRRVLADDGTVWLNLGDSYADNANGRHTPASRESRRGDRGGVIPPKRGLSGDLKPKDLIGIPWMVAFALRADGWYLRRDIIWAKTNPMPESVRDRPTTAHEYLFLLTKRQTYFYDADAIRDAPAESTRADKRVARSRSYEGDPRGGNQSHAKASKGHPVPTPEAGRNKRSVWTVSTQPYPGAHFATFPPKLIEPCILAGTREGDTVLDPFAGACTTGLVALRRGRGFIGCELSDEYAQLGRDRIIADSPLHNTHSEARDAA